MGENHVFEVVENQWVNQEVENGTVNHEDDAHNDQHELDHNQQVRVIPITVPVDLGVQEDNTSHDHLEKHVQIDCNHGKSEGGHFSDPVVNHHITVENNGGAGQIKKNNDYEHFVLYKGLRVVESIDYVVC